MVKITILILSIRWYVWGIIALSVVAAGLLYWFMYGPRDVLFMELVFGIYLVRVAGRLAARTTGR